MPAVKFFVRLDLEQICRFLDGHQLQKVNFEAVAEWPATGVSSIRLAEIIPLIPIPMRCRHQSTQHRLSQESLIFQPRVLIFLLRERQSMNIYTRLCRRAIVPIIFRAFVFPGPST